MYGAIEAGGTKMICAISDEDLNIVDQIQFPTTLPEENTEEMIDFFGKYKENLKAIGLGTFGPVDINPKSKTYGHILNTPKKGWQNFDFVGALENGLNVDVSLTTDVNAAAYGELKEGAGKGKNSLAYYTFGTGVGGGVIQNRDFVGARGHQELGHMIVNKHPEDKFGGICYAHGSCLEGLASGPSIEKRFGIPGKDLPIEDKFWDIEAYYIGQCVYNTVLSFNPEVIVLGGGVIQKDGLIEKVRENYKKLMNDYIHVENIGQYIVKPERNGKSAIIGALLLAKDKAREKVG